ncbi:SKI family transcriptional corepressor 1%2C partial [Scomber scombrus]|uniref:SKI family transcriptional corepressor 1, partial n=1 Tax=Scomber scombrus TaxID=13677 RepID=A0AAV1PPM5_SCOSC
MGALHVTYSDNMTGMRIWMLHDLIWRASPWDIDRALFGDASSFRAVRDPHIPKFPPSCVSALCRPMTFFPEQSDLISTSGGTMSGRPVHSHYPDPFINVL